MGVLYAATVVPVVRPTGPSNARTNSMTAQVADLIILNGEVFKLYSTPLENYFKRIKWRPSFSLFNTANRRGYVARWEVFGKRLFLTGLFGSRWIVPPHLIGKLAPDPDPFEPAWEREKSLRLADLFPDQAPLVFAKWVTQRLVVPTGPRLVYRHAGFASLHASYRVINVVQGRVRAVRNWDGREWARRTGRDWPEDVPSDQTPESSVLPESEEGDNDAEEDTRDWRNETDADDREGAYEWAQIEALKRPCGQTPDR
jgi:hypothetical protein